MPTMEAYVVIATKGRRELVRELAQRLARQTVPPKAICLIGTSSDDLPDGLQSGNGWPLAYCIVSDVAGACIQRNRGMEALLAAGHLKPEEDAFVVFYDDDFIPADDWLERCRSTMMAHPSYAGVSGHVLADGAHGYKVTTADAEAYLANKLPPRPHFAAGTEPRPMRAAYGCNMAFRWNLVSAYRFDENLPLYGWQEDRDFSGQVRERGEVMYIPELRGVHMGVKSGRVSGVRLGYSQIANPVYLARKGTITWGECLNIFSRNLCANVFRTVAKPQPEVDHKGRLKGNLRALGDFFRLRLHPLQVLKIR